MLIFVCCWWYDTPRALYDYVGQSIAWATHNKQSDKWKLATHPPTYTHRHKHTETLKLKHTCTHPHTRYPAPHLTCGLHLLWGNLFLSETKMLCFMLLLGVLRARSCVMVRPVTHHQPNIIPFPTCHRLNGLSNHHNPQQPHNRILLDSCVYTTISMSPDAQVVKSEPSAHTHPHKHTPASIHARTHQLNVVSVAVCAFVNSMLCVTYTNTSYEGIHNHTLQPYIVQLDVHVRIRRTVYICRPLAIIHWLSSSTTGGTLWSWLRTELLSPLCLLRL